MALWNINNTYLQIAYNFSYYFVQTYNQNPLDLWPVFLSNTLLSHNENDVFGIPEILNYLALSNIKNIDIPANGIHVQPSLYGMILINLYGSYQQSGMGIFSLSGIQRNIIITMIIVPDVYGNYYILNLIIKTKDSGKSFNALHDFTNCLSMKF